MKKLLSGTVAVTLLSGLAAWAPHMRGATSGTPGMTFFLTRAGPGNGANLGGLAGADQHC